MITTVTLNPAIDRTVTIPGFKIGVVNRVQNASDRPGGKGINVAAALAAQGHVVTVLGFLGRDNEAVFAEFFSVRGIRDECVRLPGATRTGIKIVDALVGETTDINFHGLAPTQAELDRLRAQIAALESGWCVLAGSLPPGVSAGVYRELVALLKARGVRTVIDTSGEALRAALPSGPDVIKPNVHELEAHAGRALSTEDEVIAAGRELVAGGVGLVVVSRGAHGACFITAEEVVVAQPPAIKVGSTVGAGDAMVAGIVSARVRGLGLAEMARQATAFSLSALAGGEVATWAGRVTVREV